MLKIAKEKKEGKGRKGKARQGEAANCDSEARIFLNSL